MSHSFDAYDGIASAEIGLYSLYLGGAIYLCFKHGFGRSAGWRSLIMLSLARLIGASMRLATISMPTDKSLYIGWLILLGIGLGPLILTLHGLLGRILDSMSSQGHSIIKSFHRRVFEILILVGVILLIIGGTQSKITIQNGNPVTHYVTLSYVGTAILVGVMGLLILECFIVFRNRASIIPGENRILIAVIICIPLVLVRLCYSCILVFGGVHSTPWLLLGMSTCMEVTTTFICETVGFTLSKTAFDIGSPQGQEMEPMASYGMSK